MLSLLLACAIWLLGTFVILRVDAARARARAAMREEVDFAERSPFAYVALALLAGPIPLLVYFWSTRRSAGGLLIGVAWAGVLMLCTMVAVGALEHLSQAAESTPAVVVGPAGNPTSSGDAALLASYAPALKSVAERASALCKDKSGRIDGSTSPARGSSFETDPKVVQVEVWCIISRREKAGFANLKDVPDSRLLGGIWPQRKTTVSVPDSTAVATLEFPSGHWSDADQISYVNDGVEVVLGLAR